MNKQFLKRMVDAHSWLGLIISTLLFVVFFAGSITLFKEEIEQWSFQPHYSYQQSTGSTASQMLAAVMAAKPFDAKSSLILVLPTTHKPYYTLKAQFFKPDGKSKQRLSLVIDPISYQILGEEDQFFLAKFIYILHYELNMPFGMYIIGFVTLFFFFLLASGIIVHARKLISNFFQYRSKQEKRRHLLDMHNLIGVMTLPFTIMYAISGLIFNLVIIYQIAFVLIIYKGDQQSLVDDSGFFTPDIEWQGQPLIESKLDALLKQVTEKYQKPPTSIRIYHYNDQSMLAHFRGEQKSGYAGRFESVYSAKTGKAVSITDDQNLNMVNKGLAVLAKLHFGNYAGVDLRIIYFFLGIGVCFLIVSGNLLWLEKKAKQRHSSVKVLNFVRNFTLLGSAGVVLAIAVAFFAERVLPADWINRADLMVNSFIASLIVAAFFIYSQRDKKQCLAHLLQTSAFTLILVIAADWLLFGEKVIALWQQGETVIVAVEIGLTIVASILLFAANKLKVKHKIAEGKVGLDRLTIEAN